MEEINGKIVGRIVFWGITGLIVLAGFLGALETVEAGTIKVVTRWGRVTGRVLFPGLNWITPFTDSTLTYDTKKVTYEAAEAENQKQSKADYKDFPVDTTTKDGQSVAIKYTIRFRVDPSRATWVAENIGNEDALVEKVVKSDSRIWVRNIPREFEAQDLYSGNILHVQQAIEDRLRPLFAENGVLLDELGIRNMTFDAGFVKVVENRKQQELQVQVEKFIADQEGEKKRARITAAEGMAKEQELQQQTLSKELLQKMWIEAWQKGGSQVPEFIAGNSGQFIFQVPQ